MSKRLFLATSLLVLSACSTAPVADTTPVPTSPPEQVQAPQDITPVLPNPDDFTRYTRVTLDLMDTVTQFISYNHDETEFEAFYDLVYHEMIRLHQLFNTFDAFEGVNNLYTVNEMAGIAPVEVDPVVIDLIKMCIDAYDWSHGAVDITLGPVVEIWHNIRYDDNPVLPTEAELEAASQLVNIHDIIIDESASTLFLAKEGMRLDVGAIAKGLNVQLAANLAVEAGYDNFLISAGGDLTAVGYNLSNADGNWVSGITNPDDPDNNNNLIDIVRLNNISLVTSGDYQRFTYIDGVRYHHIIDPATLFPSQGYRSVTVIHTHAGIADGLATALFILPLEEAMAVAKEMDAQALWVLADGSIAVTDGYSVMSDRF